MFDLAYVGLDVGRPAPPGADQRAAVRCDVRGRQPGPDTRRRSTTPGATALPTDLLRPYPGYGDIRMWDYSGYCNYHSLQTGINRRYDNGFMFSFFYVWSKALGINNDDFAAGVPNQTDEQIRRLDYSLTELRSAAQLRHQLRLSDAGSEPVEGAGGSLVNNWQMSGVYRWTSGRPYGVGFNIPGIGSSNLTGTDATRTRASS